MLANVSTRIQKIRSDQCPRVFMGPCATVHLDDFKFGSEPIWLRVDDRSVHVPQHSSWSFVQADHVSEVVESAH